MNDRNNMRIKTICEALLCAFVVRLLVTGASIGDALALLSLASLYGYQEYIKTTKIEDPNAALVSRMVAIEEQSKKISSKVDAQSLMGRR